jgi:Xaa-Pro aminopeptidase
MSIPLIQQEILRFGLDGWLLYDFHHMNKLMWEVLKIPRDAHITRKTFYWIPKEGMPVKIVSKIEEHVLGHLPGLKKVYGSREDLAEHLKMIRGKVAMEYSKTIPYISLVDGGMIDQLRDMGVQVVSSGLLLQKITSELSEKQIHLHKEAAKVVDRAANDAFAFVKKTLSEGKSLYEGDVQDFILNQFSAAGCITEHLPIVARGENSANPHYTVEGRGEQILKGEFLLIDLWCKKREEGGIYADITRVASLGKPTAEQLRAFEAVRTAQKKGVEFIKKGKEIRGADVDTVCREYLISLGYKENVYHRTGHNIHTELHGYGVHFDSFETYDDRLLIPKTCYSMEPALYFPGKFGLRLEFDLLYLPEVEITGGVQEELISLLP